MTGALASVVIGAFLIVFALFLAFESKMLLVGEAVTSYKNRKILEAIDSFEEIDEVVNLKTMHLSSDEVLVALEIDYKDNMTVAD